MNVPEKLQRIEQELAATHPERREIIHGSLVCLVAAQHGLIVAEPGTGKSFLYRDLASRIVNDDGPLFQDPRFVEDPHFNGYFEKEFHEATEPDEVLGAPDVKTLVDKGKLRRNLENHLAEAHIAHLGEFYNAPKPTLHSIHAVLNERIIDHEGIPQRIPLISAFMTTNLINAESTLHAVWDRVHHRWRSGFLTDRESRRHVLRLNKEMATSTWRPGQRTTVEIDALRRAHDEAMTLPVPEEIEDLVLDIHEALGSQGVVISDRRLAQGFIAILANAYVNGHDKVQVGDLAILTSMWWVTFDDIALARDIILGVANPAERRALELLRSLEETERKIKAAMNDNVDNVSRTRTATETYSECQKTLVMANDLRDDAIAAGASTIRIDDLAHRAQQLSRMIRRELFRVDDDVTV